MLGNRRADRLRQRIGCNRPRPVDDVIKKSLRLGRFGIRLKERNSGLNQAEREERTNVPNEILLPAHASQNTFAAEKRQGGCLASPPRRPYQNRKNPDFSQAVWGRSFQCCTASLLQSPGFRSFESRDRAPVVPALLDHGFSDPRPTAFPEPPVLHFQRQDDKKEQSDGCAIQSGPPNLPIFPPRRRACLPPAIAVT